ncbi:helix-turn-helix transcriptional regulator, partial [Shigella flexneri]|nr:helix-turn-helix transcriptional regulator [Escherichia coli]EFP9157846.1 helix-turn-helix transcriptional regulator [Shigella flexneri]EFT6113339.1 helix-turn-helix transcriptional regulator [Shigella sonnei]EFB8811114.1 helix-turn-helix transcriptional regulator [Escherichia coli]EFD4954610.1 helix-turn-helix transcriptional regulator [Escherichia coli]
MTSSITNEIMQLYTDREVLNMGLCSRYKSLTCNSCSMHCQIMPEESPRLQYCANSC